MDATSTELCQVDAHTRHIMPPYHYCFMSIVLDFIHVIFYQVKSGQSPNVHLLVSWFQIVHMAQGAEPLLYG